MSVATFTLVVLGLYIVVLQFVAFRAFKESSSSADDYFLSNRGVGIFALVGTTVASIFSTGTVVSSPGLFFAIGTGFFWVFFFSLVPGTMLLFGLRLWKLGKVRRYITPGEFLGDFFGSRRVQMAAAVVGLAAMFAAASMEFVAVGKTLEALTGGTIPYWFGVVLTGAILAGYLYFGGARAVVWTDVIQGMVFIALLVIASTLAVGWAGGWSPMIAQLDSVGKSMFPKEGVGLAHYEFLLMYLGFICLPYVWQRMYMARSARSLTTTILAVPIVFLVMFVGCWIIGTAGVSIFPEGIADPDAFMGSLFAKHAPFLGALMLIASFSAGVSTLDSQMLSSASLFTRDLRRAPEGESDEASFALGRRTALAIVVVLTLVGLGLKDWAVIKLFILGTGTSVVLLAPLAAALFWSRVSEGAVFTAIVVSEVVMLLKSFQADIGAWLAEPLSYVLPGMGPIGTGFFLSAGIVILGSLVSGGKLAERKAEFDRLLTE